ncbi:MAG: hypothetical protein QXQ02_10045 [Halobacteria archaeon]
MNRIRQAKMNLQEEVITLSLDESKIIRVGSRRHQTETLDLEGMRDQ